MKKSFIILTLLATMVGMSSCRYYTQCDCPQNGGGGECYYNKKVINFNVSASDWQESPDGTYLFAHISVPELTKDVYSYGAVSCFAEFYPGTSDAYQLALPATTYLNYEEDGQILLYQEKIDFIYGIGWVEVDLQYNDYFMPPVEDTPGHPFKLVLQW